MSVAYKIKKLFFSNSVFKYKRIEGQTCKDNIFYVGPKAGASCDLSNLCHEICHFAEREPPKLLKFPLTGWGLSSGKYWRIGARWGYEPSTDQQVLREARVWAFQYNLQKELDLSDDIRDLVESAVWLPAFCFWRYKGPDSTESGSIDRLKSYVEKLSKEYTYDRLINDFNDRIGLIERSL